MTLDDLSVFVSDLSAPDQDSNENASSAPANLLRLGSGKMLLLWNRLYPEGRHEFFRSGGAAAAVPASRHREELSLAFSDDGRTWSAEQTVILLADTSIAARYYSARTIQLDDQHVGTVFMNRDGVHFIKVSLARLSN